MDKTTSSTAKRQAAYFSRIREQGWRKLSVRIPPDLVAALEAEMHRTGETATAIVVRLLHTLKN